MVVVEVMIAGIDLRGEALPTIPAKVMLPIAPDGA